MSGEKKKREPIPVFVQIFMPLLTALLCGAVIFLLMIKPYENAQTYFKVAFMDDNMTVPQSGGIAGLNIVETDIDTEYSGEVSSEGETGYTEYGTQYAVLECRSAGIYVPVYWGSGTELLEKGACNSPSSAMIGASGNTVISAHVNTFFSDLSEVKKDDEVILYTGYGRFTYKVRDLIEFKSSDKSYIKTKDEDILTLYTCEKNLLAESDKRVGVVCTLEKKEFYKAAQEVKNEE